MSLLRHVPGALGQSLNGHDVVTVGLHRKHQAGAGRLAIEYNRARAAHSMFTADMCASQPEFVTQEITQQHAWLDSAFVSAAIDGNSHLEQVTHR